MITLTNKGGRIVELFLPFEVNGIEVSHIMFSPISWGQTQDWREGKYRNSTELLLEIASIDEDIMRGIRYPDVERVLMQFMDLLPPEIRDDIARGSIPQQFSGTYRPPPPVDEQGEFRLEDPQPAYEPPLMAEDTPDMTGHAGYAQPDKFDPEEWKDILPVAAGKPPEPKPDEGLGFDLGEK